MTELPRKAVFIVDESNEAAWSVMKKICMGGPKPGAVIRVSKEEFDALNSGVIIIDPQAFTS